jgi:formylglycine-generating enzyme required for sulfatase activity
MPGLSQSSLYRVRWLLSPLAALAALQALTAPEGRPAPLPRPATEVPEHKDYTETIPGSKVRFRMVAIPGGTFVMGSRDGEKGRGKDEGPRHRVKVAPFWMGRTEVTWDEYDLFRRPAPPATGKKPAPGSADAVTRPSPPYIDEYRDFGREGYPVVGITHHAAMEYCRWLSRKTGKAYRLPTEAEWEYACRAGTRTAYPFGNDPKDLPGYAWYEKNSGESTHPVGKKKPNRWGLYDMHGNVAEWCLDHYRGDYYRTFPEGRLALAPVNLPTADPYPHVARGGSWADPAAWCRSAARRGSDKSWNRTDPDPSIWWLADADFVGFRVARAVAEQKELRGLRSRVTRDRR